MSSLFPDYIPPATTVSRFDILSAAVPARTTLNSVATTASERQIMTAADSSIIPIIYGRQRVGGRIAIVKESGNFLYILSVWCLGECEEIEGIIFDGENADSKVVNHYTGTTAQSADPILASIISGYTDNLVITKNGLQIGVCYSVLKVLATDFPNNIEAIIKGKKVYDPRSTLTEYSTNPSLCMADFISNDIYGQGRSINWTSVGLVADDNDEIIGGLKRRELNLSIDTYAQTSTHVEAFRAYSACFIVYDEEVKFISNRPAAISRTILAKDIIENSLKLTKSGTANIPTVVKIVYTDTSSEPWKDAYAIAETVGLTEIRESIVNMQGITTYAQAKREAIERLNAFTLSDLSVTWNSFDESLADQAGDIVEVSHPKGLTSKQIRIVEVVNTESGRYTIKGIEYDPAVYSDNLESEPTYPDTTLPSPINPLPVDNLVVVEELFQQGTGTYSSRLRITWDAPSYPYVEHYRVVIKVGVNIVFEYQTVNLESITSSVLELTQHNIEVFVYSGLAYSDAATEIITPQGKFLPPDDVSELTGFEAGGSVHLSWSQVFDIDMWRYEVRYGSTAVTWDNADILDRVDALRLVTNEVSAGTWDFLVKALDSVGNYSENEVRKNLTVSIDDSAFLVDTKSFTSPVIETNLHTYKLERSSNITYDVSDSGEAWDSLFPNAMSTYTNSTNSYQSNAVSEFLSETKDFGIELSGNWAADLDYSIISGTVVSQLELSTDNFATDTQIFTNLTAKATARYARIRIKSDTGLFIVNWPVMTVRIDAIPKTENGQSTSLSTAGGKTITLDADYTKLKKLTITPISSAGHTYSVDNILVNGSTDSFDVYIFDSSWAQVAGIDFLWNWEGV